MGGKTGTSTSSVQIPPEVLARYNAVNTRAEQVANTPFQRYGGEFVAPLTGTQMAGINATNQYSQLAQPYFGSARQQLMAGQNAALPGINAAYQDVGQAENIGAQYAGQARQNITGAQGAAMPYYGTAQQNIAGAQGAAQPYITSATRGIGGAQAQAQPYYGMAAQGIGSALSGSQPYQTAATMGALAGGQAVNPEQLNIGAYMSPYTQNVAQATYNIMSQQQGQQRAQQQAQAAMSGAFGGDRSNLAAAQLAGQQQLATAGAMAPIYQQGYAQALAAAQQQQGVGLMAEQANRAAQQQMAAQMLGIGQQGYQQQMEAAQMRQALGQGLYGMGMQTGQAMADLGKDIYGMRMGTGQAMAGLGKDIYGMRMGTGEALANLGQQQYAQQMGAAQQRAALAGQRYGMGAQTSQQLAGLGTGAQQAALQGAQAQIGAGTLEQQTKQAQDTALYQQFLQERGYPFQVAQFLANIAMGTGALSGSTTTSTYPMPFFSDERLKEDVKEIGETHDGQPIYSFKYKGKPGTQIGLMAQDVEKHHPEAVYETPEGIKAVDYKAATEGSEKAFGGAVWEPGSYNRGGYEDGGAIYDPNFIREILAQQREGMGPFGQGGIYGQKAVTAPYEGKGIVPSASLPVAALKTATPPKQAESTTSQIQSAMDMADKVRDTYSKGNTAWDKLKDLFAEPTKAPLEMGPLSQGSSWNRGGIVPRDAYALSGTVTKKAIIPGEESGYDYFPEDILDVGTPSNQPDTPPTQQGGSGGSGLGTALSLGKFIFGLFKDGGTVPRGHLADGGVYDPITGRILTEEELKQAATDIPDVYSRELNPAVAPRFRLFEKYAQESGAGIKPSELYRTPERSAYLTETMPAGAPVAGPYQSGHNYGLAVDYSGVSPSNLPAMREAAAKTGLTLGADFSNPDLPHVQYGKKSFGGLYPQADNVQIGEGFGSTEHGGVVPEEAVQAAYGKARSAVEAKGVDPDSPQGQSLMSGLTEYFRQNQGWMVPLGGFFKSMVQSRSPYLGGALLEGLGGGLEAVGAAQMQQAEIAQKTLGIAAQRFKPIGGGMFYDSITGETIPENVYRARLAQMPGMSYYMSGVGAGTDARKPVQPFGSVERVTQGAEPIATSAATKPVEQTSALQVTNAANKSGVPLDETTRIYAEVDKNQDVRKARQEADQAMALANDPANIAMGKSAEYRGQAQVALGQWRALRDQYAAPLMEQLKEKLRLEAGLSPDITQKQVEKDIKVKQGVITSDKETEAGNFIQALPAVEQVQDSLINAYTKMDMNRLANFKADAIGVVKSLPALDGALKAIGYDVDSEGFQGLADAAAKDAITEAFRQLAKEGSRGTTDQQLVQSLQTVAEPGRSPAAKYNIVTKQIALQNQQKDRYNDFLNRENRTQNWSEFVSNWDKNPENKIEKYTQDAVNKVPYFAGMTEQDVKNLTYKKEGGANIKGTEAGKPMVIQGIPIPKSLEKEIRNLEISPDKTMLRNKNTGVIYDAKTGSVVSEGQ